MLSGRRRAGMGWRRWNEETSARVSVARRCWKLCCDEVTARETGKTERDAQFPWSVSKVLLWQPESSSPDRRAASSYLLPSLLSFIPACWSSPLCLFVQPPISPSPATFSCIFLHTLHSPASSLSHAHTRTHLLFLISHRFFVILMGTRSLKSIL